MLRFQFTDPVPTEFPAPREVDRELYGVPEENIPKRVLKFPAPREVGR